MLEDKPANGTLRCQLRTYLEQGLSSLTLLLRAEAVQVFEHLLCQHA